MYSIDYSGISCSNKLYNWAYILMNILQAKNTKHKFFEYRCLDLLQKRSQMNKQLENFLAITDVTNVNEELKWEELRNFMS